MIEGLTLRELAQVLRTEGFGPTQRKYFKGIEGIPNALTPNLPEIILAGRNPQEPQPRIRLEFILNEAGVTASVSFEPALETAQHVETMLRYMCETGRKVSLDGSVQPGSGGKVFYISADTLYMNGEVYRRA